jgi:TonB family protein
MRAPGAVLLSRRQADDRLGAGLTLSFMAHAGAFLALFLVMGRHQAPPDFKAGLPTDTAWGENWASAAAVTGVDAASPVRPLRSTSTNASTNASTSRARAAARLASHPTSALGERRSAPAPGGPAADASAPGTLTVGIPTGDFYLSGVQARIWAIWQAQPRNDFRAPAIVEFRILSDGSVADVSLIGASDDLLVDLAAQRAVGLAAPFAPLPAAHGHEIVVRAVFSPHS